MATPLKGFPFDQCDKFIERIDSRPKAIKIFALGDSWLAVPGGWWPGRSVIERLNDPVWVRSVDSSLPGFNIVSISKVGMVAADMATDRHLMAIDYINTELAKRQQAVQFDAVMISAGGNDIIPNIKSLVLGGNGVAKINEPGWQAMLTSLESSWQALLQIMNRLRAPIVANGYGPIIPTSTAGTTWLPFLGFGPWAGPYLLKTLKLSLRDAKAVVAAVIDRYNDFLSSFQGISYFDLREVVSQMPSSAWHDEIHFLDAGWDAVARQWVHALGTALPMGPVIRAKPAQGDSLSTRSLRRVLPDSGRKATKTKTPKKFVAKNKKRPPIKQTASTEVRHSKPAAKSVSRRAPQKIRREE
jgi:hypothetical protein